MAYARPFGQPQAASPWSSGVPPGGFQQPQAVQQQPMFNQPMGAFDISGTWQQGQPQAVQQQQQWAQMPQQQHPQQHQVQFVPNTTYMQPQQHHPMQQQRPMHQRSLSAPRIGAQGLKRGPVNQNQNNFGGPRQHWGPQQQQQRGQQNNNQYQQRMTRQQTRMNNNQQQKGGQQFNNNNNNNINNNNAGNKQPRQQNQQQQQSNKQAPIAQRNKVPVKVTKVKKQVDLKAKLKAGKANVPNNNGKVNANNKVAKTNVAQGDKANTDCKPDTKNLQPPQAKGQSKTAERKQLKLQARKNAEALKHNKLPVAASRQAKKPVNGKTNDDNSKTEHKVDEPIDQAQLKCVPAVFGFVCKLCDVFLRDKNARREHIDSEDHMQKFKTFEEAEKLKQEEVQQQQELEIKEEVVKGEVKEQVSEEKVEMAEVKKDEASEEKMES